MGRRWLLVAVVAAVVTVSWAQLESGSIGWQDWLPMLLLALPAIGAVALGRSRLVARPRRLALLAASIASESRFRTRARPIRRATSSARSGRVPAGLPRLLRTQLPFDRVDFPAMHTVVLLAIFGFTVLVGMLVMARRPVGAALGLVVAVAWPATLVPTDYPLRSGPWLSPASWRSSSCSSGTSPCAGSPRRWWSASAARRRRARVDHRRRGEVGVPLMADVGPLRPAHRGGLGQLRVGRQLRRDQFPETPTTVMRVKVPGLKRSLYWRATTLDDYTGLVWDEDLQLGEASEREQIDASPLLPEEARNEEDWIGRSSRSRRSATTGCWPRPSRCAGSPDRRAGRGR